jgi:hypothetical protein
MGPYVHPFLTHSQYVAPLIKGCTRLAAGGEKVYQLLSHDRWFCSVTPAFSATKTGRHDIAEILLKVAPSVFSNVYLQFLCIVHFVFPLRYSLTFIYSFSVLYIFYCPFGIL